MYSLITSARPLLWCCLALLLLTSCRRSTDYFEQGNKFYRMGRYDDAALNYRNAIQKNRKFGEAYYMLGLAEGQAGNREAALGWLATAETLLPNRTEVVVNRADLELEMLLADPTRPARLYNDLVAISDKLLSRDPDSYDGLRIKGNLAMLDAKPAAAIAFFKRANTIKPMQAALVTPWARVLLEGANPPEGEQLALNLIEVRKTFGPIYDILVRYYMNGNRRGDAEKILKTKVDNNPDEIEYAIQLAGYYASSGQKDAMSAVLQRLLHDPRTFPAAHLKIGDFYTALQDWPNALQQYQEGAKTASKDRTTYLKRVVDTYLAEGKGQEAAGVVAEILKADPKDEAARAVDASLLVGSGQPDKMDAGVKEMRELVTESPGNPIWRFNLGLGLMAKGDLDGASVQLEETIKNRPGFLLPLLTLSQVNYLKHNYEKTLGFAEQFLAEQPDSLEARLMRAAALTRLRRYPDARTELMNLERALPNEPEVQFQLVALDVAEKKFSDAERRIQKLSSDPATQTRALAGVVTVFGQENRLETAFKLLTDESKKQPGSDAVLALLGSTALRLGHYDQALASYQILLQKNPKSSDFYRIVGAAYVGKGDRAKAIENFEQAVSLAPNDPASIAGLADLLRMAGRTPEAIARYRRLLQLEAGSATAMNNLAWLLADSGGNLDEAERLEQHALQLIPNEPSFTDTLGIIYTKKKNGNSVPLFESLVRKYPDEAAFRYHYGLALMGSGNREKAKTELQTALLKNPAEDLRRSIGSALANGH